MTEDEKIDVWCRGRVDGMGNLCPVGSYVQLVLQTGGQRHPVRISTGAAENLIAELQAALAEAPEKPKPFPHGTRVAPV